ncbi:MAG: putative oxidoreductase of the aldo/keto reductase family, partial [Chthonomonadales bacterium]|nr:putative oxidoreductase of the aldo/keto reductase family [Chthonomonadales bacterium]
METEELASLRNQYPDKHLSRRNFVRVLSAGTGLVTAGLTGFALTPSQRAEAAEMLVEDLGKLPTTKFGRLPFKVSPISMSQDWQRDLFAPAVEIGVNFIHKAGYFDNDRKPVPDAIKKLPRESYYTDITVDNTSPGHDPDNYDEAYNQVKDSLAKNGMKYYDIYRAHYGWHSPDKVMKENNTSYKAFLKLQKEGLVKSFGVSQHPYDGGPREAAIEKYAIMIQACIDSGIVDSMQVWYSYGYPKEIKEVFAKASTAGIAMTAMKIYSHGRDKMKAAPDLQKSLKAEGMIGRALLRNVMTEKRPDGKPIFQTCVSALGNMQLFEENIGGVSKKVA